MENKKKDIWDKADTISKLLSSVVIAIVGIAITYSIHQSQIKSSETIAKAQLDFSQFNAERELKIEQARLTSQLMEYLTSPNSTHRKIAIVALKDNIEVETYQEIIQLSALYDENEEVRIASIKRINISKNNEISKTLVSIINDSAKSTSERKEALSARVSSDLIPDTKVIASNNDFIVLSGSMADQPAFEDEEFRGGIFTYYLLKALKGAADRNNDNLLNIQEIFDYARDNVIHGSHNRQIPEMYKSNFKKEILISEEYYDKVYSLSIGINKYKNSQYNLKYAAKNAQEFSEYVSSSFKNSDVSTIIDDSKKSILNALSVLRTKTMSKDLVFIYFSGHAYSDNNFNYYLASNDFTIENPYQGILFDHFKNIIESMKGDVVLILDTSNSGHAVNIFSSR